MRYREELSLFESERERLAQESFFGLEQTPERRGRPCLLSIKEIAEQI